MKNSVYEIFSNTCLKYGDNTAIIINDKTYTYHELAIMIDKIATFLQNCGLKKFDRALLVFENTIYNIAAFWACAKIGIIPSISGPIKTNEILSKTIIDLNPKIIFCKDILQNGLNIKHAIFIHTAEFTEQVHDADNYYHITDVLKNEFSYVEAQVIYGCDLAAIIYTSGSTGYPKGVMLTHRNMMVALHSINNYLSYLNKDVVLCFLPLSFDYGLYQILLSTLVGSTVVLIDNLIWIPEIFKLIAKYRVTILPLVSTIIPMLHKTFKQTYDTSSIKKITNTGAYLSIKNINSLEKMFVHAEIFSMYGLTECKRCSYVPPEKLHKKPNSIGIPIPHLEMFVLSEDEKLCEPGEHGQIAVRGEAVMQGYWGDPVETKKKLREGLWPGDKLLLTGDYGYVDKDGFFYLDGRVDDLVKIRGYKVQLKSIESVIRENNLVMDASAFCYKDQSDVEQIAVAVILEKDSDDFETEILQYCKTKLLSHEVPKKIYCLQTLPKNINGKVNRDMVLQSCMS